MLFMCSPLHIFFSNRKTLKRILLFLLVVVIQTSHPLLHSGLGSDDEVRLVHKLFLMDGYNPLIRPVRNLTEYVKVKFGMAMIQLINVDEKNQIMKSNVWLRMLWNDYQLQWDPSDYGGINVIRIMPEKVWKPDIVLFNNADGKYEVSYKPNVVIYSTGDVLWIPPAIYKSSCTIDVTYFPFDQQECQMKFGSWTFNGDQVILDWYEGSEKVDLSDYVNSGTWNIISCPGVYNRTWDAGEAHHKAQITFTLKIRRMTLFYTVNLIIPCVLISFLSVCVFYLPADAGEKMTMCISILLALVVFLLLVSKILPPTSLTIPLIAKYLLFTFIMNIFTILITVIIINWNFKTPRTHRMPKWIRVVFLNWLPRVLIMTRPHHSERWSKKAYSRRRNKNNQINDRSGIGVRLNQHSASSAAVVSAPLVSASAALTADVLAADAGRGVTAPVEGLNCLTSRRNTAGQNTAGFTAGKSDDSGAERYRGGCYQTGLSQAAAAAGSVAGTAAGTAAGGSGCEQSFFRMTADTQKAIEAVRFIAAHLQNEDDYAEILEDWRYIAMVIDRLQLYIFLAVTIGGTVGILINAPHIFDFVDQDEIKRTIIGGGVGATSA